MIAYLEKYDTTVDVPNDMGEKEVKDVNDNFHSYVDTKPAAEATTPGSAAPPSPGTPPPTDIEKAQEKLPEQEPPKWQPNFYESVMSDLMKPVQAGEKLLNPESPEAQALGGKTLEGLSFGTNQAFFESYFEKQYKDHPAFAYGGTALGGMGALMASTGVAEGLGLGELATAAGKAAVPVWQAGQRFIPQAIMRAGSFGTQAFIRETIKAFEDGHVNLEQFGKDVVQQTAFGGMLGGIEKFANAPASVASAGGLFFILAKMNGADNREAMLQAAPAIAFELVGQVGKSEALRMEALNNLKGSIGEYVRGRNPDLTPEQANAAASAFVDHAVTKAGFKNAEAIAKSGPENLLEGIEKVNQMVRTAQVPHPGEPGEPLPKLPAPVAPEAPAGAPAAPEAPKGPLDKAIETVKGMLGIEKTPEPAPPAPAGPQSIEKSMKDIGDRLTIHGLKDPEKEAIFNHYAENLPEQIRKPIEEQYQDAYKTLAAARGITSDKPDAATMDQAEKAVDLINDHFNPKSQEVLDFAKVHPEASVGEVAQMAHNRGMLESPNPDLLMSEMKKATQEKIVTHPQMAPAAAPPRPAAPQAPVVEQVAAHIQGTKSEISNLVAPYKAAPLAAANLREKLGLMARRLDMGENALEEAHKMFAKWTPEQVTEFYDRAEHGLPQTSPELDVIDKMMKKGTSDLADEIHKETGKLPPEKRIPNYMARYWEQGEQAIPTAMKNASKRPWPGSKAFLKSRTIGSFKEGVQAGLTPSSWNPVDLWMMKIQEMSKFLVHRQTLREETQAGRMVYKRIGQDHPEGWEQVPDSDVYKSPMIAVKEAYDEKMMNDLNQVGQNLGIDLERGMKASGEGQRYKDAWGLSQSDPNAPGQPGKIWTKFAGPESALAHELGHQIDHIYGLQDKFLSNYKIDRELQNLANERATENASAGFKKYIQQPSEKMAVMFEAYIHAPDLFKEVAPTTNAALTDFLKNEPKLKPLMDIEPSLQLGTNQSEVYAGGAVIAGHYYAPPDSVRLFKNYLSPGLSGSKIFRGLRFTGNTINQFQLGFSAFHANFTSMEALATQLDLSFRSLASGDIKAFAQHGLKTVVPGYAGMSTYLKGNELLKAWRGDGQSPIDEKLANLYAISGGRAHMGEWYHTRMLEAMQHNFKTGRNIRGIMQVPLAIVDAASRPIMEKLVPGMKAGIFSEMMGMELKNNPNMTHDEARRIGGKIVDTIDDRMGQIIYSNLFWNNTFKDSLMLTFRSVGWNHGLVRLVAGAFGDLGAMTKDVTNMMFQKNGESHGIKSEHTYRIGYWIASAIALATYNAIYQKLKTGKGPDEPLDYLFPKNGGVDAEGKATRSIPFQNYYKDLYHLAKAPVKTFFNKSNPLPEWISEVLRNRTFNNTQIVNPYDSDKGINGFLKQAEDEAKFAAGFAVTPFSISNMKRNLDLGNRSLESVIGPWVGDIPAPYDIGQSKAEQLAHDINMGKQSMAGRTEEQAQRAHLVSELTRNYKSGDPKAAEHIEEAYQKGLISHAQKRNIFVNATLTPLQRMVKGMSLEEAQHVYSKATTEEKAEIQLMLDKKNVRHQEEYVTP